MYNKCTVCTTFIARAKKCERELAKCVTRSGEIEEKVVRNVTVFGVGTYFVYT